MRTISCIVARLTITQEFEGLGYAQLGARQHDRQQHHGLRHGQSWSFFLTASGAGPKSDAPTASGSYDDANRAMSASHSDPSPARLWPLPAPSPRASVTH